MSIEFTRINNDSNGNPRYVCHFLAFISDSDKFTDIDSRYALSLSRAKKLGGRKFHNKQYGGGIVFQSYNIEETGRRIEEMMKNLITVRFFMETGNGSEGETPFAVWDDGNTGKNKGFLMGYAHVGQHTEIHPDYLTDKKKATRKQYMPLLKELESIGYYVEVEN